MSSLLRQLALTPAQVRALPDDLRTRVVDFLLRWEAYAEAQQCLGEDGSSAALELRARAARGLGHLPAAIALYQQRIQRSAPAPILVALAQTCIEAGDFAAAATIVATLQNNSATAPLSVQVQGDLLLAQGQLDAAESIFQQLARSNGESRQPYLGLVQVYERRGDPITAAAFAHKAIDRAARTIELSVPELVALRNFFQRTADNLRVQQLNEQLIARFDRDRQRLQEQLAQARTAHSASSALGQVTTARATQASPALAPVTPIQDAAVSTAERRQLSQQAQRLFGYTTLLPGQAEVMAAVARGEHVLAILPTGAGKSLCYQLPAFTGAGLTLVISPLIALMKDQLDSLPPPLRQQAAAINSSMDGDELRRAMTMMAARHYRLVYVAPERLRQQSFVHALRAAGLSRMVIDEAHCVSIWGHDFRPDFLHLAQAHRDLGAPPLLAMTATAPPQVRADIERQLFTPGVKVRVLAGDTFRPNLQLSAVRVRDDDERIHALAALLAELTPPGIVYARSRQRCEDLATLLRSQGVDAAAYHAGLPNRSEIQDRFMAGQLAVVVATIAFGMGVDKADIRFIVHFGLPDSVEGYYQEIGRAGRDGKPAHCVLLYASGDERGLARLAGQDQLDLEALRRIYAALVQGLAGRTVGPFVLADLAAAAKTPEHDLRVGLSLLEQAGLVRRHYDAPRSVTLQRQPQRGSQPRDPAWEEFAGRVGLLEQSVVAGDFLDIAEAAAMPLATFEAAVLQWQAQELVRYRPAGRALLLERLSTPGDAEARIGDLLTRRAAIGAERIAAIAEYAATRRCRHGYLAGYLGGAARRQCGVCDNCGGGLQVKLDDFDKQARIVLQALAEQGWGRRTLTRLLRGDPAAGERAQQASAYGMLAARDERSLGQLIDSLVDEGLITTRKLSHGGLVLELSAAGAARLRVRPR
ncbi:MAG: RecQ family ATP-dependent DNA helicase [Caldilineaceae bacterium]|nr:RecQ family ATP-dependent DNA helicase [Caldilineaceae bacterium]